MDTPNNPECTSFLILWHATGTWEWVKNHEDGPHDYAWGCPLYGKSQYSFVPCDQLPESFAETPEDTLLKKIFSTKAETTPETLPTS